MSENNNEDIISSLYPPPPPFVKFFTTENVKKLEEWKQNHNNTEDIAENEESPPGELKLLIPPKAPEQEHYRGYGNLWSFEDKLPNLEESGWKQLYKENDENITSKTKIEELHKLMDSLLLNFLEVVGIASIEPQQYHGKIEDIKLILINISHILNTYRPHQSRESLITLLKKQIETKKNEINDIDRAMLDIKKRILKSISTEEPPSQSEESLIHEKVSEMDNTRKEVIDALLKGL
ncbi:uncharacterized protein PRCAT00002915001 [Priceomyces carsonii]|uniref:uncharacterized protein n=1 Tax=Priceomyces carsonii TaxID=28549 RepID=UPI002ED9CDB1|nr:unnamed protein product [Priceomyces carsonii]